MKKSKKSSPKADVEVVPKLGVPKEKKPPKAEAKEGLMPGLELPSANGKHTAATGKPSGNLVPGTALAPVVADLQSLQRQRAIVIKSRNMQANRLQAIIAGTIGFHSGMEEKERKKKFAEATELIKAVVKGEIKHPLEPVIKSTMIGIDSFNQLRKQLDKDMDERARKLPVAAWVDQPEQRGFSFGFLGIIIGETGDLANYAGPAKLWRRLGCAPWEFDGKTQMGATWRSGLGGKLPKEEWSKFGYSPRRRSIAYLIGENIVKQNGGSKEDDSGIDNETSCVRPCGPYRACYDKAKEDFKKKHPEYPDLRIHRHAMLVATKLLLKKLWCQWNNKPVK